MHSENGTCVVVQNLLAVATQLLRKMWTRSATSNASWLLRLSWKADLSPQSL